MAPSFDSPDPPPATGNPGSFSQPRPRPPRSPGRSAQIRAQNRRRAYLERHPSYLQSSDHELADPLLYDFLIRRFQTPAEREAEARAKGYARVLEGSLLRGEERLARLRREHQQQQQQQQQQQEPATSTLMDGGSNNASAPDPVPLSSSAATTTTTTITTTTITMSGGGEGGNDDAPGTTFSSLDAELKPPPKTKEEGRAQWDEFLRDRFIRGEDEDFDYSQVDEDDEYDVLEREEREEAWFESEDPGWATSDEEGDDARTEKMLEGETGIQDF